MISLAVQASPSVPRRARLRTLAGYFLRLGALGFGGPIALAARMQRDLVDTLGWISEPEYEEGLVFSQLAPGPLAAQLAMYLGYVNSGMAGATVAGTAFVLPSLAMVIALAAAYVHFGGLPWVQASFYGVGPSVIGLIAVAACRLGSRVIKRDRLLLAIFVVVAAWTAISQRELVLLFIASGAITLVLRNCHSLLRKPLACFVPAAMSMSRPGGNPATLLLFFAKAGLFVFGSGLAIVPFLYAGVVQERHWLTDRQFLDAVAVAMITPGPVVITVAFIGYIVAGLKGATLAAIGIFAPVYVMVVGFAPAFRRYGQNSYVRSFVAGATAAAAGAIAGAVTVLGRRTIHDIAGSAIAAATVLLLLRWKLPEPGVVAAGALAGIVGHGLLH